jgi:hypothetical protein
MPATEVLSSAPINNKKRKLNEVSNVQNKAVSHTDIKNSNQAARQARGKSVGKQVSEVKHPEKKKQ